MRKVLYSVASSLDGFIARHDGAADWILMNEDYGLADFFATIDTLLIGRKTFEPMRKAATGKRAKRNAANPFAGMKSYVFSRTLKEASTDDVIFVADHAGEVVRQLKAAPGKDIWLWGGGELAQSLFAENLIDEIGLAVQPVLLGQGVPLFHAMKQHKLELIECKSYRNGVVGLCYRVKYS